MEFSFCIRRICGIPRASSQQAVPPSPSLQVVGLQRTLSDSSQEIDTRHSAVVLLMTELIFISKDIRAAIEAIWIMSQLRGLQAAAGVSLFDLTGSRTAMGLEPLAHLTVWRTLICHSSPVSKECGWPPWHVAIHTMAVPSYINHGSLFLAIWRIPAYTVTKRRIKAHDE